MRECPRCRGQYASLTDGCPSCEPVEAITATSGPDGLSAVTHQTYVPIARFGNVAEAGYFHSELEGQLECDVRLTAQNQFDAASATWWSCYVLSVPAGDAERATFLLKQLASETESEDAIHVDVDARVPPPYVDEEPPFGESRIHWTPIILTLTAGTFVLWAAKQVHRHLREPAGGQAGQVHLWEHLGDPGAPWVQRIPNSPGRRELIVDEIAQQATLREDNDGDGVFERSARFSLAPAGR